TYPVSPNVPGEAGHGLAPGSCAWDDRAGLAPEGGTIAFVTAANAQLAQARSGSAVDRSATAADRWPDAQTIPVYLTAPSRYWTFPVAATDPDSARHHAAWMPALGAIAGERSADPGATSMSFDPHDVRAVVVTPGVAGVEIQFEGP